MEASFFEFVQPTAQALLPLLTATDEVTMLCDEARSAAFQCWALLIKCARKAAEAAPQSNAKQVAQELLGTFLPTVCKSLAEDKQADTIREGADGLAECIKNGGQGCIEEGQLKQIAELMFTLIQASLKKPMKGRNRRRKMLLVLQRSCRRMRMTRTMAKMMKRVVADRSKRFWVLSWKFHRISSPEICSGPVSRQ